MAKQGKLYVVGFGRSEERRVVQHKFCNQW